MVEDNVMADQTIEDLQAEIDKLRREQTASAAGPSQAYNPTKDYFQKMKDLQLQNSSLNYNDISARAQELSALMPQTKRRGLYGMATDLSRGLVQSAEGRTPVGTGLAMGFNLYSEGENLRQIKAEEIKSKLMQMAYQDVERRRQEARDLDMKMLDVNFKYEVERLKTNGSNFPGSGDKPTMMNWLLKGARLAQQGDYSFLSTWEYKLAYKELQREKVTTLPDGTTYVIPGAAWVKDYPEPIYTADGNPVNEPGAPGGGGAESQAAMISRLEAELLSQGYTMVKFIGMNGASAIFQVIDPQGNPKTVEGS
jgi:hypothetical protein